MLISNFTKFGLRHALSSQFGFWGCQPMRSFTRRRGVKPDLPQPPTPRPDALPPKQPEYLHQVNYNFEEHRGYTKLVQEALSEKAKRDIAARNGEKVIPRRNRRKYDRPKFDLELKGYDAWRSFDKLLQKHSQHCAPIVAKIRIAPALLRKVFGDGARPDRNLFATKEYDFEDVNLDIFHLYDYKATTAYWGERIAGYDYDNQSHLPPRKRKYKAPTPEEFWSSQEPYEFRLNCTRAADYQRFKKWLLTEIAQKAGGKSFEEMVIEKYGPVQTFDKYDETVEIPKNPAVLKHTKEYFFTEKGDKLDPNNKYSSKFVAAKRLDDQYKVAVNVK